MVATSIFSGRRCYTVSYCRTAGAAAGRGRQPGEQFCRGSCGPDSVVSGSSCQPIDKNRQGDGRAGRGGLYRAGEEDVNNLGRRNGIAARCRAIRRYISHTLRRSERAKGKGQFSKFGVADAARASCRRAPCRVKAIVAGRPKKAWRPPSRLQAPTCAILSNSAQVATMASSQRSSTFRGVPCCWRRTSGSSRYDGTGSLLCSLGGPVRRPPGPIFSCPARPSPDRVEAERVTHGKTASANRQRCRLFSLARRFATPSPIGTLYVTSPIGTLYVTSPIGTLYVTLIEATRPGPMANRVILHFDYDCFYASVVEHERPALKSLPLAIQQKQIVVTCNYEARRRGLHKLQLINEARRICPDVVIVLGEDLTRFRDASKDLYNFLRRFVWSGRVERLGFDEVWYVFALGLPLVAAGSLGLPG